MLARLAPIRSWMMADCLRSTQVCSPARFRTPKNTMPASSELDRRGLSSWADRRSRRRRRRRTAATPLRRRSFRSSSPRTERRPRPAPGRSPAVCAKRAGGSAAGPVPGECSSLRGVGQRRKGAADALDSAVAVHEGPVLFHIGCGRQDPMGQRGSRIFVRSREDEQTASLRDSSSHLLFAEELRQVVPEDPQGLDASFEALHRRSARHRAHPGRPGPAALPRGCWEFLSALIRKSSLEPGGVGTEAVTCAPSRPGRSRGSGRAPRW